MLYEMLRFILAVLAFVVFPFAVIFAAAGVLAMLDRMVHRHH